MSIKNSLRSFFYSGPYIISISPFRFAFLHVFCSTCSFCYITPCILQFKASGNLSNLETTPLPPSKLITKVTHGAGEQERKGGDGIVTVCTSVCLLSEGLCVRVWEYDYAGERESEKTSAQHACSGADDLYHTFVKKILKLSILFQR